jgi:hypothetical protein
MRENAMREKGRGMRENGEMSYFKTLGVRYR